MDNNNQDRFIVSVKVGPKGQITIPKEAREMFDIKEGETLMVLGDKQRGIAIISRRTKLNERHIKIRKC